MKIVAEHSDYSLKQELEPLIIKMANLSKYQPILVESPTLNKDKQMLFEKRQEDYYLFEASILYLFSKSAYIDHISSVFTNLTCRERSNFQAYYKSFTETATKHGFLTEYTLLLKTMHKWTLTRYIKLIGLGVLFFLISTIFSSFLTTLYFS